ncbi:hypothetical protein HCA78_12830 [Listeria booriae]|uniref:Uncharacterized protein n=1 Tax=Listeria booriae TaxID=1552123 RepID=A0A842CR36_9LIST|nr:hypothetical protein [Listeria booriae]MBC2004661.1 hypothetical protein [Listeria booriae]
MSKRLFTEEEEMYLEYYILCQDEPDFNAAAQHLNCTTKQIKNWRGYHLKKSTLRRKWTERECAILRRFHPAMNVQEIAKMLNRPYSSVARKASNMGLKKLNYPNQLDAEIRKLGESGYTAREIAEELQFPLQTIREYLCRCKIKYKKENKDNHAWKSYIKSDVERNKNKC